MPSIRLLPVASALCRSGSSFQPTHNAMAVTGMLTIKMARQLETATRSAAIAGPATPITPHTVDIEANARGRSTDGIATPIPAVATVMTPPANMPWAARATMRVGIVGAAATMIEVIMNPIPAIRKVLRTPALSTIGPAASTATAEVSSSMVMTQGNSLIRPRSSPMSGRTAVAAKLLYEAMAMIETNPVMTGRCRGPHSVSGLVTGLCCRDWR